MSQENDSKNENEKEAREVLKKLLEFAKVIDDNFGRKLPPKTDKTGVKVKRVTEEE